ncbi:MAG TPA: DUF6468 domain-containing protein [Alphaproteobacteria bacterium]
MNPQIMVALDALVIMFLMAAIYYMRIVAGAMKTIREGKTELQQVLKEMTLAIGKADETIQGMKRLADDKTRLLQKQMDGAQNLIEELKFINHSADHLAQRLTAKASAAPAPAAAPAKPKIETPKAPASKAEKDLAAALQRHKSGA